MNTATNSQQKDFQQSPTTTKPLITSDQIETYQQAQLKNPKPIPSREIFIGILILLIALLIIGAVVYVQSDKSVDYKSDSQDFKLDLPLTYEQKTNSSKVKPSSPLHEASLQGDSLITPDQSTEFFFPKGSFNEEAQVETIPVMHLMPEGRLFAGGGHEIRLLKGPLEIPYKPIQITIHYNDSNSFHLDESTLAIHYGDSNVESNPTYAEKLETSIDIQNNIAIAEGNKFGAYALLGELICPSDTREYYNDQYKIHGGQDITYNQATPSLFDIKDDVDWYFIKMTEDKKYTVSIINIASGVVPIIELSDDGLDINQDNKNNLETELEVDQTLFYGYVQIKLSPKEGSKTGCDATYDLLVKEE